MPTVSVEKIGGLVGTELGVSDWFEIAQDRINQFADCTEDHQFIHIDEERAAQTPFGGTIAHGFLTMSLLSGFADGCALRLENVAMGINYGFEKGRFINPVRAGKRVRARFVLKSATEKKPKHWMINYDVTMEIEGEDKPAMMLEWVTMQVVK